MSRSSPENGQPPIKKALRASSNDVFGSNPIPAWLSSESLAVL